MNVYRVELIFTGSLKMNILNSGKYFEIPVNPYPIFIMIFIQTSVCFHVTKLKSLCLSSDGQDSPKCLIMLKLQRLYVTVFQYLITIKLYAYISNILHGRPSLFREGSRNQQYK